MYCARRLIFTACLLIAGGATSALAGGFGSSSAAIQVPAPIPIPDYANTFYLRGDFGWALYETPDIGDATGSFTSDHLGDDFSMGAGFGYNFRDNIRGDITVDYRSEADVSAWDPVLSATHRTNLSTVAVLANVYFDLQGRHGLTPYIGGGIGLAYNETEAHTISTGGGTGSHGQAEFAAALMAGFSYRMSDQWLLDAGYRYLYLGEAKSKSSTAPNNLLIDDISAHELRAGVRYEFQ